MRRAEAAADALKRQMKPKNQRLVLVAAAIVAVLAAVLLAMWGLKDRASYFYTPGRHRAGQGRAGPGDPARRNGRARLDRSAQPDGVTIRFVVTDGQAQTPVIYRGIVPDLFREGSGRSPKGGCKDGDVHRRHDPRQA